MGISIFVDVQGKQYFRVYRKWDSKTQQAYVAVGDDRQKSKKEAELIDKKLAKRQYRFNFKKRNSFESLRKGNGLLKHIGYRVLQRRGRKPAPELRVRIPAKDHKPEIQHSISISLYGFDHAYESAITMIIDHYAYAEKTLALKFLLESKAAYLEKYQESCADIIHLSHKPAHSSLMYGDFRFDYFGAQA